MYKCITSLPYCLMSTALLPPPPSLPPPQHSSCSIPKFAYFDELYHATDAHQTFPTTWKFQPNRCHGTNKLVQVFFYLILILFLSLLVPYICSVRMASYVCWDQKHFTSVTSRHSCLMLLLQQVRSCPVDLTVAKCDFVMYFTATSVNGEGDVFSFIPKHFLVHNRRKYCI